MLVPCKLGDQLFFGAEVVELEGERSAVRRKASSVVQLCVKEAPSLVYEEEKPKLPKVRETRSKIKFLFFVDDIDSELEEKNRYAQWRRQKGRDTRS